MDTLILKSKTKQTIAINTDKEEIEEVYDFKFPYVILNPQLKFDKHVKKMSKTVETNLKCFQMIRHYIPVPLKAAQLFMHAMIFSHFIILCDSMEPGIPVNNQAHHIIIQISLENNGYKIN